MTLLRWLLSIALIGCIFLAAAPEAAAQKRIGVIMTGDIPYYRAMHEALVSELNRRTTGGGKVEIILQKPFPDPISWSNAARKLIAFDVDLIVTYGLPATQAVMLEKSRIPLVYAGLYEPDHTVVSGKYVTGCGFMVPLSSILRYFKQLKTINRLGIIFSSLEEDSVREYQTMQEIAQQQEIKTDRIDIRSHADLDRLKGSNADAVLITGSTLIHLWLEEIMATLHQQKVPTADIFPDTEEDGVLMTLYPPAPMQGQMAGEMAFRILHGEKPDNLDPHIFRDTELVFNLVAAKQLGITFPVQLIVEATRVIK